MSAIPGPELASLAGPFFLATCLNWALYGALCVQVYFYFLSFPNDKIEIKVLVWFWILIETIQSIIVINDGFNDYGTHFGDTDNLDMMQSIWFTAPVVTGIVSLSVQLFFAYRIMVLSDRKALFAVIAGISLLQAVASFIQGAKAKQANRFSGLYSDYAPLIIWLLGGALCDVLIAVIMTWILMNKTTGFRSTDAVVSRLVRLIIETGTLTAAAALTLCIVFFACPTKPYHSVPALVAGKLYSNSALAILNSRINTKGGTLVNVDSGRNSSAIDTGSTDSLPIKQLSIHCQRTIVTKAAPIEIFLKKNDKGSFDGSEMA